MAKLSTASCLSIATAHGWIYELRKPCQTCGKLPGIVYHVHSYMEICSGIAQSVQFTVHISVEWGMRYSSICNNPWFNIFNFCCMQLNFHVPHTFLEPFRGQLHLSVKHWHANCSFLADQRPTKDHAFSIHTPKSQSETRICKVYVCP